MNMCLLYCITLKCVPAKFLKVKQATTRTKESHFRQLNDLCLCAKRFIFRYSLCIIAERRRLRWVEVIQVTVEHIKTKETHLGQRDRTWFAHHSTTVVHHPCWSTTVARPWYTTRIVQFLFFGATTASSHRRRPRSPPRALRPTPTMHSWFAAAAGAAARWLLVWWEKRERMLFVFVAWHHNHRQRSVRLAAIVGGWIDGR